MTTTTVTTTTKNHTVEVDCVLSFEAVVEELRHQQQHLKCKQKRPTTSTLPIAKTYEHKMVDSDCFMYFNAVVAELISNRMEQVSDEWDRSWDRSTSNSSDDGDY
jgi:hypothetical protein